MPASTVHSAVELVEIGAWQYMYTLGRCIEHDPFHFAQIHHHAAVDGIPGGAVAPAAHGDPYVVRLGYRQALQNVVFADAVDDDFWVGLESRVGFLPRVVVIRAGAHHDAAHQLRCECSHGVPGERWCGRFGGDGCQRLGGERPELCNTSVLGKTGWAFAVGYIERSLVKQTKCRA